MREEYEKYFRERVGMYGEDVRTLWGSDTSQQQRFAILSQIGDLNGQSILDVGCGFGDFLGYLRARNVHVSNYLGLECVDEIISVARRRYPEARFANRDVLELVDQEASDYVFASGIFFLPCREWEAYVLHTLKAMYSICRVAVATNFLSRYSSNRDEHSHYADPGQLLALLMDEVSPITVLRHNYRSNDFTVFLYKTWRNTDSP